MLPFNSNFFTKAKELVLHILFPNTCYACRRDLALGQKEPLCENCLKQIKKVGPLYCRRCGKPLPDGGAHCYQCRGTEARQFKCKIIRSASVFGPQIRALVHAFKYADQSYLSDFLSDMMCRYFSDYTELSETELIIPVPLHVKKVKKRGYNQAELLAESLAKKLSLPLAKQVLKRVRNTPSQTKLGREERLKNMSNAFECINGEKIKGKVVLLIDDVATTGATLEGCAVALKKAGVKKVMAYTFARET